MNLISYIQKMIVSKLNFLNMDIGCLLLNSNLLEFSQFFIIIYNSTLKIEKNILKTIFV